MNRPDIEGIRERNATERWTVEERQAKVSELLAYITDLEQRLAQAERVVEAAKVKCLGSCPNGWGSQVCDGPCGWLDLCAALAEWEGK